MKRLTVIALLLSCCQLLATAQTEPVFTQYWSQYALLNPGATGGYVVSRYDTNAGPYRYGQLNLFASYKTQWAGIEGAPQSVRVYLDHSAYNSMHSYGGYLLRDSYGPFDEYRIFGCYAFNIKIKNDWDKRIGLGLQGGIQFFQNNWDELTAVQQSDPAYDQVSTSSVLFNFGFGIHYQSKRIKAGVAIPHILNNQVYLKNDQPLNNYYVAYLQYRKDFSSKFDMQPSILARYSPKSNSAVDLNLNFIILNRILAGVGYRTNNSALFVLQYQQPIGGQLLSFGYSYDMANDSYRSTAGGSHEVSLAITLYHGQSINVEPKYY